MYLSHIILFVICLGISYGYPRRDSEEFVLEENYSEEEIGILFSLTYKVI